MERNKENANILVGSTNKESNFISVTNMIFPSLDNLKAELETLLDTTNNKDTEGYNPVDAEHKLINVVKRLIEMKISAEEIKKSKLSNVLKSIIDKSEMQELVKVTKRLIGNWKKIVMTDLKQQIEGNTNKLIISKSKYTVENFSGTDTVPLIDLREDSKYENSDNFKVKLEKEERDPTRRNTKTLLYNSLIKHENNSEKVYNMTLDIEEGLYKEYFAKNNQKPKYLKQAKQILMNIQNNKDFLEDVLCGQLKGEAIAIMNPQDFASEELKQQRKKLLEDAFNSRRSDWNRIKNPGVPGIYRCGKCKNNKTTYYQAQIRRADEPMTTFITCLECNHSWKQ